MGARKAQPPVPERHPALRCVAPACTATFGIAESTKMAAWSATLRGWGVVGDIVLCPIHAGRTRTREPALRVLPGQDGLFDLVEGAVVEKRRRGKGRAVN